MTHIFRSVSSWSPELESLENVLNDSSILVRKEWRKEWRWALALEPTPALSRCYDVLHYGMCRVISPDLVDTNAQNR